MHNAKRRRKYLQEFIDYYIGIGFSEVILLDNSDNFQLASWQGQQPGVTVIEFPPVNRIRKHGLIDQQRAIKLCVEKSLKHGHTWMTHLDTDEFLVLHQHDNVVEFAKDQCPRGHVAVGWRTVGFCGQEHFVDLPVVQRFQCRHNTTYSLDTREKSLVFLADVNASAYPRTPHYFPRANDAELRHVPHDVASIYHYHTRSVEEFVAKRIRGSTNNKGTKGPGPESIHLAREKRDHEGNFVPSGTVYDPTAWRAMLKAAPSYARFDRDPAFLQLRENWTCLEDFRDHVAATRNPLEK